ncbi:signal peptidase I [candidate division KSB1 bacterium]|nr:signal peptidase I [candidate division KSB1 bacterium]
MNSNNYYRKASQSHKVNHRKWWIALFLSFIPGLGQIYNGQTKKGFLFLCLTILIPLLIICATLLKIPTPFNLILPILFILIAPIEAINIALHSQKFSTFRLDNRFLMNLLLLILLLLVLLKLGVYFFVASYQVKDDSMFPSLLKNEFLLIEKFSSLAILDHPVSDSGPKQGDLLLFRHPLDGNHSDLKRCIALAGQVVEVRNGEILINGKAEGLVKRDEELKTLPGISNPFEAYQVITEAGKSYSIIQLSDMVVPADNYGPVRIPQQGDQITFPLRNEDEWSAYVKLIQYENHTFSRKPGSNEVLIDGEVALNYVVAHDYYFVLGDNRDQSQDSRHWGFLSGENIVGRPSTIYFSRYRDAAAFWSGIRWGRIGKVGN